MLREVILEHLFVGQLLQYFWSKGQYDVEILRSEFDAHGHDLVIVRGDLTRHVQLKTKLKAGKAARYKLALGLGERPSGCVIVIEVENDLTICGFRYFGRKPGERLPNITDASIAKHTKGNAVGVKLERASQRDVALGRFDRFETMEDLAVALLG